MFKKTVLATFAAFAASGVAFAADDSADAPGAVPAGVVQVTDTFVDQPARPDELAPLAEGFKEGRDTVLGAAEPVTSGLAGAIESGWAMAPPEAAPLVTATQAVDDAVLVLAQGAFGAASAIVTLPSALAGGDPATDVPATVTTAVASLQGGVEGAAAELGALAPGEVPPPDDGGGEAEGVRGGKVGEVPITATGFLAEIDNRCRLTTTAIEFTFEGAETSFSDFSGESQPETLSISCGSEREDTTVFLSTTDNDASQGGGSAEVSGSVGEAPATFTIRYSDDGTPIGDAGGTSFVAADTAAADIELLASFDKELFRDTGGAISFDENSAIFVYIDDQTAPAAP